VKIHTLALALIFTLTACVRCVAGTTGIMHGYVRNEFGQPVADALVTVTSPSQTVETYTDSGGFFVFLALPPDVYTVKAEKSGTSGASANLVRIDSDQPTFLNLHVSSWLRCGPMQNAVTIAAYQGSADIWSLDVRRMEQYPPNVAPLILQPAPPITLFLRCL
jgi:carboxypeptidase family protein